MSTEAIVMMVVAMVVLWGGLLAAVLNISRRGAGTQVDQHDPDPGYPEHSRRDL